MAMSLNRDDEQIEPTDWESGIDDMMRGGLQYAASTLLGQGTQARAGQAEMFRGLTVIEAIREGNRRGRRTGLTSFTAKHGAAPKPSRIKRPPQVKGDPK